MTENTDSIRAQLRAAERADPEQQWVLLCFIAGRHVTLDVDERMAVLRRAELLLAAGGDPRRPLELYGRAVTAIAADLDTPGARTELGVALGQLAEATADLRGASEALRLLSNDPDLAWQCFAMALLAEELASDD